jgi:hypothetical protein
MCRPVEKRSTKVFSKVPLLFWQLAPTTCCQAERSRTVYLREDIMVDKTCEVKCPESDGNINTITNFVGEKFKAHLRYSGELFNAAERQGCRMEAPHPHPHLHRSQACKIRHLKPD